MKTGFLTEFVRRDRIAHLLSFVVLAFFFLLLPLMVHGKPESLVPCGASGQDECTICHLVTLAKNLIDFFVYFSIAVATLLFLNAGALYVFSSSNPGNVSKAHRIFTTTLTGLIIVLSSWLIIDFVMKAIYNEDGSWGPWNKILC